MPAQLTRPISLPMDTALATTAWPSASLLTSQRRNAPPISLAMASPFSTCMSAITTLPPLAASMRAVPSPSPEAPPVTIKTLPEMSIFSSWLNRYEGQIIGQGPGRATPRRADLATWGEVRKPNGRDLGSFRPDNACCAFAAPSLDRETAP